MFAISLRFFLLCLVLGAYLQELHSRAALLRRSGIRAVYAERGIHTDRSELCRAAARALLMTARWQNRRPYPKWESMLSERPTGSNAWPSVSHSSPPL
jgi:hypothetical protein